MLRGGIEFEQVSLPQNNVNLGISLSSQLIYHFHFGFQFEHIWKTKESAEIPWLWYALLEHNSPPICESLVDIRGSLHVQRRETHARRGKPIMY